MSARFARLAMPVTRTRAQAAAHRRAIRRERTRGSAVIAHRYRDGWPPDDAPEWAEWAEWSALARHVDTHAYDGGIAATAGGPDR